MADDRYADFDDYVWEDETLAIVMAGANYGIPAAKAELQRREKLIDTVSAKALSIPEIQADWIED